MENKCNEFKEKIAIIIDRFNSQNIIEQLIHDVIGIIDEMYILALNNNLIKNTENPTLIDNELYEKLNENLKDQNMEKREKDFLIENFKQLLIDQLNVLYIINCKPTIKDEIYRQIIDKQIAINKTNRFAKEKKIFTDGIPFRKIKGGNIIRLSKLYYKAYKNLYYILLKR
jgi:hypothetical protein